MAAAVHHPGGIERPVPTVQCMGRELVPIQVRSGMAARSARHRPLVVEVIGSDAVEVGNHDAAVQRMLVRLEGVGDDEVRDARWVVVAELVAAARADL